MLCVRQCKARRELEEWRVVEELQGMEKWRRETEGRKKGDKMDE